MYAWLIRSSVEEAVVLVQATAGLNWENEKKVT